jgi:hypothetical protein
MALVMFSAAWAGQAGANTARPITLDPQNPHYFLFRGKAVALITSGEHYGSVINPDFDYRLYLKTIQADGFNYTRIFGGSYVEVPGRSFGIRRNDLAPAPGRFIAPWARSDTPGYAGGGNKFDLDRWNPVYFNRLHDFLTVASNRGIVVEIGLFSSEYGDAQWNLSPLNPANNVNGTTAIDRTKLHTLDNGNILAYQERYTRKLVDAGKGFDNVVFQIQNEPWSDRTAPTDIIGPVNPYLRAPARDRFPNAAQFADGVSMAWQAKVAEWITSEEASLPQKHLIAGDYSNFRYPVRNLVPGISIINFHYAYPQAVLWNYGLGKPIAYDETGFLGRDDGPYRRQAWNFMLSGGSVFDALDYSFSPGHADGTDTEPNGPGGGSPAFRSQLHVLIRFLQSFDLVNLRPDFETVKHSTGTIARVLSDPGREYAIYFDGDGPTEVTLSLPAGRYAASWINVATGTTEQPEEIQSTGHVETLESPAFVNGIALRLKRIAH